MKITTIFPLIMLLFLLGCSQESQKPNQDEAPQTTAEEPSEHKDGHGHAEQEEPSLSLNHGEKWKVNDDMMVHVRSGEDAINAFESADEKDYSSLASDLKENIDLLTNSCTMTGEAHDQLHVWLMPYMALVDKMATGENDTEGEQAFSEIQASFTTFNAYFQ